MALTPPDLVMTCPMKERTPVKASAQPTKEPQALLGERRPCPADEEPTNFEGLFMAPKPPKSERERALAASAPEFGQMKHGPPPKRPRCRPMQNFVDPSPLDLPRPDVPMSGEDSLLASSCPAFITFRRSGSYGSNGVATFGVPAGHQAGTPTVLEDLEECPSSACIPETSMRRVDQSPGGWTSDEDAELAQAVDGLTCNDMEMEEHEGTDAEEEAEVFAFSAS